MKLVFFALLPHLNTFYIQLLQTQMYVPILKNESATQKATAHLGHHNIF